MRRVRAQVRALAADGAPVLIEGETGTGKGLVARAIHQASPRREGPFVVVSAVGLGEPLLASRLFGHVRGTFPETQAGLLEAARGGTLLLDGLGDLPLGVQAPLLHALETEEIVRLGESAPRSIDVRTLVATNRPPEGEVAAGRLRRDLLEHLRQARIVLPPLRDRIEDIPLLAIEFLQRAAAVYGKTVEGISREAVEHLTRHPWPGNVRELDSAIECAVIWCTGPTIRPTDLPPELAR